MGLQEDYQAWHNTGMDLAFNFTQACQTLLIEIFRAYQNDSSPEVRCWQKVPITDSDTFESAWLDDNGRPCCEAKIEDGAPMGWRVEFLDLHLKQQLHKLLQDALNELPPNNVLSGSGEREKHND